MEPSGSGCPGGASRPPPPPCRPRRPPRRWPSRSGIGPDRHGRPARPSRSKAAPSSPTSTQARSNRSGRWKRSSVSVTSRIPVRRDRSGFALRSGPRCTTRRLEHEAERAIRRPRCDVAAVVFDSAPLGVPDGVDECGQCGTRFDEPEPARRIEVEALDKPGGSAAKLGRQRGKHLEPRGGDHRAETELGGRPRQAGQEERLCLVGRQAGEARPVPVDEADPAVGPPLGIDRHAGLGERLDVAMDGADRKPPARRPARQRSAGRAPGGGAGARRAATRASCEIVPENMPNHVRFCAWSVFVRARAQARHETKRSALDLEVVDALDRNPDNLTRDYLGAVVPRRRAPLQRPLQALRGLDDLHSRPRRRSP